MLNKFTSNNNALLENEELNEIKQVTNSPNKKSKKKLGIETLISKLFNIENHYVIRIFDYV